MGKNKYLNSVNIIGSGIGGLFCGAILAKYGLKVNIFEERSKIGGYASSWKRKDFLFDSSLHELNGFFPDDKKLRAFRFLGLFKKIKLIKIPSCYTSLFNDFEFKVPHDFEEFKDKLIDHFPAEKKNINIVMNTMKNISNQAYAFVDEKSDSRAIKKSAFKYRTLIKYMFSTVYDLIWKKIKTSRLRTILAQMIYYYSHDIRKMNLIYFSSPTYTFINEAYWISGTSSSLSAALKNIIEKNGGKVYLNSKVTKIIFKDKKAIGVRINNSNDCFSDITISNSPILTTVREFINKRDISFLLRRKALKTIPSTSLFSIYLGMNIDVKKIGIKEFCYMINELDDIDDVIKKDRLVDYKLRPIILASYLLDNSLCPKGKTVVNLCVVDNISYWDRFKNDKKAYSDEKKRIADILIERVNEKFNGFAKYIEVAEIATPLTMKRFTGNPYGSVYGACQRIFQGNLFRFPNEIKNKNLYFCGSWVRPGGGFSGSIVSAIRTSDLILKKYSIKNQLHDFIKPLPALGFNPLSDLNN